MRASIFLIAATLGCAAATPRPRPPIESRADPEFLRHYAETYRFRAGRPAAVSVTPGADAVLFLRSGPRSRVRDLYSYDVATGAETVLLTAAQILEGAEEQLTDAEKARRERMRLAARGIATYRLSKDGARILVPLSGRLFVIERKGGEVRELKSTAGYPIDARFSEDARFVAAVREADLYVIDVSSGKETRLTRKPNDHTENGLAEFVAQEEMGRYRGYWWSPDGEYIAYQQTDTDGLEIMRIADPAKPQSEPQAWPYPRPGKKNATVRLGVIPRTGGQTTWIDWDRDAYPYLARVVWSKNAPLTLVVQNRRQTELQILTADPRSGRTTALHREQDDTWLNLDAAVPRWLEERAAFLWTSERAGYWQLELRHGDGSLERTLTASDFGLGSVLSVDEPRGHVYVTASTEPTERHLYRVSLSGEAPQRLTDAPGEHWATFAEDNAGWVVHSSLADGSRRHSVIVGGEEKGTLADVSEAPGFGVNHELITVGENQMRAVIIRPRHPAGGVRYPVIVSVYAGPHVRIVRNNPNRYLMSQWLADHGFIVVSIDGRGTPGRGRAWERVIHGSFVDVQLADQIAGLTALGARYPEMDLERVGIYGWSYGGYMSAMAAIKAPQHFHAAIAGAPVTDWLDYDTHYTERYIGLPEDSDNYEKSSVLTHASALRRPLLLIHGTSDDNVYFSHSIKLSDALFRAGKHHEFLPLAGFTHMVPDPVVTERLYQRIAAFMVTHVQQRRVEPRETAQSRVP